MIDCFYCGCILDIVICVGKCFYCGGNFVVSLVGEEVEKFEKDVGIFIGILDLLSFMVS